MSQPVNSKNALHITGSYLSDSSLQKGVEMQLNRNFEFRHVLSRFGRGVTRFRGSFIVSITDTSDEIAKFISTRNAICGMFKS